MVVAGAGLAGLAAAHQLMRSGAEVTVVDSRDRVGGRVHTIREPFTERQHAEAGGDMIDEAHHALRSLADELGLSLVRILRGGFGYARQDTKGRIRIVHRGAAKGWDRLSDRLDPLTRPYRLAEQRWDSPIVASLARRSVAQWLDHERADDELRVTATGLRGFFLADPDQLSLVALVDQFSVADEPAPGAMYRIAGGNDRLAAALARRLGNRIKLATEVVAVSHRGRTVRVSVKQARTASQLTADFMVLALPATTLRRVPITPSLPPRQHEAIARLKYGAATKTLLQFSKRFWRLPGRPRAFGTPLPIGALWEANEEQRGHAGILALLAGGGASAATQTLVAHGGIPALGSALDWLGSARARILASRQIVWESDPWSRGGYAFFDPAFEPGLREWLAKPFGRLFFAGEHTSVRWQGYMNGAVESGLRAAAEIEAVQTAGLLQPPRD